MKAHKKVITSNTKFDSIELKFTGKPTKAALAALHGSSFKWAPTKKHWYAKDTKKNRAFAENLVSNPAQTELNL